MEIKFILRIAAFTSVLILNSCSDLKNPKERIKLDFNNSINAVAESIKEMNKILIKTKKQNYVYAIDSNQLYINENKQYANKLGLLTDNFLFENKSLSFIDTSDRKHFISLATYLNENYLSRCDIENGQMIYIYRADIYMGELQTDLFRYAVFANSKQEIDLTRYKILDSSGNLYLLADKNAKIWEN